MLHKLYVGYLGPFRPAIVTAHSASFVILCFAMMFLLALSLAVHQSAVGRRLVDDSTTTRRLLGVRTTCADSVGKRISGAPRVARKHTRQILAGLLPAGRLAAHNLGIIQQLLDSSSWKHLWVVSRRRSPKSINIGNKGQVRPENRPILRQSGQGQPALGRT